jgi:hypothetical protein
MLKIPATALCLLLAASANVQAQQPGLLVPPGADVQAQQQDAQYYIETLRNGIGILKHCQSSGHLTPDMANEAIAYMEGTLNLFSPTPEQMEAGAAAEKKGADGKVGPASVDIAESAKEMGATPALLCQDMHAKIMASTVSDEEDYKQALQEAYQNARNKIGVIRYCGEKGHIAPARAQDVANILQQKLPPDQNQGAVASGDAAEKEGAAGKFGLLPPQIDLVEMGPQAAAMMCETFVSSFAEEKK